MNDYISRIVGVVCTPYGLAFLFNCIDFVTGWLQSIANNTFKSSVMREGIFHKLAFWLVMLVVALYDFSKAYVNLGAFSRLPVAACVCGAIIIMELGSIMENIHMMNDEIPGSFKDLLDMARKVVGDDGA